VSQGDAVNVRILEIDGERRRLSLSLKRVDEGDQPVPRADGAESVHQTPDLKLSEEAFPTTAAVEVLDETEVAEADVESLPEASAEPEAGEPEAGEPEADEPAEEAEPADSDEAGAE
jgi:small subunit ribosomal protein S1